MRALQAFAIGDVLGEYLGEQYPVNVNKVPLEAYPNANGVSYRLEMNLQPRSDPVANNQRVIARNARECWQYYIDSAVKGNWTRYMNHSCAASMRFENKNLGRQHLLLIIARRAVKFGAELTVDYGDGFWNGVNYACNCGENVCRRWDASRKNNPVNLGQYNAMTAAQQAAYHGGPTGGNGRSGGGSKSGTKKAAAGPKRQSLKINPPKAPGADGSGVKSSGAKSGGVKNRGVNSSGVKKTSARSRAAPASGQGRACQECNQAHLACGREKPTCAACQRRNKVCRYPA